MLLQVGGELDDAGREARDLGLGGADVGGRAGDEGQLGEVGADAAVAGAVLLVFFFFFFERLRELETRERERVGFFFLVCVREGVSSRRRRLKKCEKEKAFDSLLAILT